MSSGAGL